MPKAKTTGKTKTKTKTIGRNHKCYWREAAVKLARCVVATLQADGKIGMGSGLVMSVKDGKRTIERWDKDFIEALAFIGIEMVDKPPKAPRAGKSMAKKTVAVPPPKAGRRAENHAA